MILRRARFPGLFPRNTQWLLSLHDEQRRMTSTGSHDLIALTICVASLALSLWLASLHQIGNWGVETDFYSSYVTQARNLLAGRPYTYQHNPPGYMLILAFVSTLTRDFFLAGKIIGAFSSAVFGWLTYLLLRETFGSRVAVGATLLMLVALVPNSYLAGMDIVSAASVTLALWLFLRPWRVPSAGLFLAGLFCGVAYLIRYSAVFLLIGCGVVLILGRDKEQSSSKRLKRLLAFFAGVIVVTAPWLYADWQLTGAPFSSTAYLQIAANLFHPKGDSLGTTLYQQSEKFGSLGDVVSHNPLLFFGRYLYSLARNLVGLGGKGLGVPLVLFVIAGLVMTLRRATRDQQSLVLINGVGILLMGLVGYYLRYYFFAFPLLFGLVAYSLCGLLGEDHQAIQSKSTWGRHVGYVLFSAFVAIGGWRSALDVRTALGEEPRHLIPIAEWLQQHASPSDVIVSRKPHLGYVSGLRRTFVLAESAEEFRAAAEQAGARFIVYSDFEARLWPGLSSLGDPGAVLGMTVVYEHEPTGTLVYELDLPRFGGHIVKPESREESPWALDPVS